MSHKSSLIAESIEAYLNAHQHKGLLRFMTCGSVDDGKKHADRAAFCMNRS